ncbi:MAG: GTPase Era [Cardiobacteriaceae bacterium]|nr:GTPase Era [Cardiobacteriaceae bacterium]
MSIDSVKKTQAGFVAIVGRPNVGKSTLLNKLLGQKIAITSRKPQTTRHNLLGIFTEDNLQAIFIDTPGIHSGGKKQLNRQMNRAARKSMIDTDVIIQVVESGKITAEDIKIMEQTVEIKLPKICVINKIDRIGNKEKLLAEIAEIAQKNSWQEIIPISAEKGQNTDAIIKVLNSLLPQREWIFPEDQITTAGMRYLCAELIREKLFRYLHQEVPYELGVIIEGYKELKGMVKIDANIIVERESQKAIVIGKNASVLKAVGTAARIELEKELEQKVLLKTFVSVKNNWRDNAEIIANMNKGGEMD